MPTPAPKISRYPRMPLIWVVPVIALGIAGWMMYREWRNRGPEITIQFADGTGLESGQTKVDYKGVVVGQVTDVELADDLGGVSVRVQLARSAASIAREGTRFWIVQPKIGFGGVSGLDTLLKGPHLGVVLGKGAPATRFVGLQNPPTMEKTDEGRAFLLLTDRLGGLQVRAPVLYRDVKVGEVEAARLADDSTGVWIRIRIKTPYVDLVRTNTRFWNAGGSPLQISLFGGGGQKKSLQSIITGAIAFSTPEAPAETAPENARFDLDKDVDQDWLKWSPHIPIKAEDTSPERSEDTKVVPELLGG